MKIPKSQLTEDGEIMCECGIINRRDAPVCFYPFTGRWQCELDYQRSLSPEQRQNLLRAQK